MELDADLKERLSKYPAWISDVIRKFQSELTSEKVCSRLLQEEIDKLVAYIEDNPIPASDTVLISTSDNLPDQPLGDGVTIRFGDFYDIHYHEKLGLILETDGPMALHPQDYGSLIITKQ